MMAAPAQARPWTVRTLLCTHCKWSSMWVVRKTDRHLECPNCGKAAKVVPLTMRRRTNGRR